MSEAFERYGILGTGLVSEEIEIAYAGPQLTYRFDFGYEVAGRENLLHALGTRSAVQEATRLGFVMDRLRRGQPTPRSLTTSLRSRDRRRGVGAAGTERDQTHACERD